MKIVKNVDPKEMTAKQIFSYIKNKYENFLVDRYVAVDKYVAEMTDPHLNVFFSAILVIKEELGCLKQKNLGMDTLWTIVHFFTLMNRAICFVFVVVSEQMQFFMFSTKESENVEIQ